MIYFDNSATTKIHPQVLDTYMKVSQRFVGNPSSLHRLGEQSAVLLNKSRQQISEQLGCQSDEIYFTSGGTEGNNWVLKGTALTKRPFGHHLILSTIEHPSVSETAMQLQELGFSISWLPVTKEGIIDVDVLESLITPETILVSTVVVNSEVGTIQPIREISHILEKYPNIHYHVDAVQGIGKIPTSHWLTPRVDFATCSAHKFHGPRGTGFIYWKKGAKLGTLLTGGGQENNRRSGTENTPAIVSSAKALRLLFEDAMLKQENMHRLKQAIVSGLMTYENVQVFSPQGEGKSAPHILCFGIKGVRGEVLVHALEEKEIYISTTSACSSRKKITSSTLHGMGVPGPIAETAVRISLDSQNTMTEVEQFLIVFKMIYQRFSKINS